MCFFEKKANIAATQFNTPIIMGEHIQHFSDANRERNSFIKRLLQDIAALDLMIDKQVFEKGATRIGAEQEFCIVDSAFKPCKDAGNILPKIGDAHFTTELAKYNLEINLDPMDLGGDCFSIMEADLTHLLEKADIAAANFKDKVILCGILPSIDMRAVDIDFLTPSPRYFAFSEIIRKLRGEDFELNIAGVDELLLSHHNILFEACNTSFQTHLQIDAEEFVAMYNWAQAISGPVLSICTNSPLLFGKELWHETRIALFQQSLDMRTKGKHLRETQQRVYFGKKWIEHPTESFKDDIARFPLLLINETNENALEKLEKGEIPTLAALRLHNGTIWKWNRPCYGIMNGVPHLRIECRYIPSGPTAVDEIANMVFWTGLMKGMPERYRNIAEVMDFEEAKENFYKAATTGIHSGMTWEGEVFSAQQLILQKLLPIAKEGLLKAGVSAKDIAYYLGIIEARTQTGQTGSKWMIKSFRHLKKQMSRDEAIVTLTAAMHKRRITREPVHTWSLAEASEKDEITIRYDIVGNVMSTDLFTVKEDDPAELVAHIMQWRNIRHVPVESPLGELKGIITHKRMSDYLASKDRDIAITAAELMQAEPITVKPEDDIRFAMLLMLDKQIGCLPVIENQRLVGIITDIDTQQIWAKIMV